MPGPKPTPSVFAKAPFSKSFWQDDRTRMLLAVIALLAIGVAVLIFTR